MNGLKYWFWPVDGEMESNALIHSKEGGHEMQNAQTHVNLPKQYII